MKRVMITGMSGLIGGVLRRYLEELGGYELSALNRSKVEGVDCLQADIADLEAIKPAFEGKDVVVHLAASLDFDDWESNLSANVVGTYNVYEAARQTGVKRVVFASSGATVMGFERDEPYKAIVEGRYESVPDMFPKVTHDKIRPHGVYGASKVWGEALGRYYSDEFGISVLCVRISSVKDVNRPGSERENSIYLSHRDCAEVLRKCIDAPADLVYDVFFAASANKWGYRDLEHPREVLGWEPQDSADTFS